MRKWCLYRHIRLDKNEVFYIGLGKHRINKDYSSRPQRMSGRNNLWTKITNKTNWRYEIVLDNLTFDEANVKEIEFIKLYGRINQGTGTLANLTDGGDGCKGYKLSNEAKDKIRQKAIGRKHDESTRKKMSDWQKGRKRRPISKEHREKLSNSMKGKIAHNKGMSKYNEIELQVFNLVDSGFSESKICQLLNISKGGLYRLKQKNIQNIVNKD
jgi:hypothetical protein